MPDTLRMGVAAVTEGLEMGVRLSAVAFVMVLLVALLGRASPVNAANASLGPSTPDAADLAAPELDPDPQSRLLTIDANGFPSASPEINVLLDSLDLPEPVQSFGIGRGLLVLLLALGTFVAVRLTATLWQRRWGHGRIAHF
jgi:hypothetical protein